MQTVTEGAALRQIVAAHRRAGRRLALVPTMGNLHAGHYSLIEIARRHADIVIASVFVNPTQFGPNEDFARYPRTLAADSAGLVEHGCDLLFAPAVEEIYPYGIEHTVQVRVPGLDGILEGAARPGHFTGVATVVTKLFNLVAPDLAVFGQKDYQQLLVIRRLTRDLGLPIEILAGPTLREANGLARSSRNQYLSDEQRTTAAVIQRSLRALAQRVQAGESDAARLEQEAIATLQRAGLLPDYVALRDSRDLSVAATGRTRGLVALVAARLGTTRLIDNVLIDGPDAGD